MNINLPKKRSWRGMIFAIALLALLALAAVRVVQSFTTVSRAKVAPTTQIQLKASEVVTIAAADFAQTLPLSGALTPYRQATVSARASGEVMSVLVREGQSVRAGETLAVLNQTSYQAQLEQALAAERSAKSSLNLAEQDYANNERLVKENFISPMALQKIKVTLESARAQLQNATQSKVIAQRALSEVNIKAPIAGVVAARNIQVGESAAVGMAIFQIVNIDAFELQAPISAEQVGMIRAGQAVELSSNGVAQKFTGVVERINPAASNGSRSYEAYIRVDNPTGALKAGMFAQGQIVIAARNGVVSVPATALHARDKGQYVYVIDDGKLAERAVSTGAYASDAIDAPVEITSGLAGGDMVVRLDLGQLKLGTAVTLLDADGNAPTLDKKPAAPQTWWQKLTGM